MLYLREKIGKRSVNGIQFSYAVNQIIIFDKDRKHRVLYKYLNGKLPKQRVYIHLNNAV